MTSRDFFFLVANMRSAQREYFKTKDRRVFAKCRALEVEVDREVRRVLDILDEHGQ